MSESLRERFDRYEDEFLRFEKVENPRHPRPDVCAFLILHDLAPDKGDMVSGAEHDEIFIDVSPDALDAAASDADILTLVRCGVRLDSYTGSLAMFV